MSNLNISGNKQNKQGQRRLSKRIYTLDCETNKFSHGHTIEPFIWGLMGDDGSYRYFYDTGKMVKYIKTLENSIIYLHNGGKFDILFLAEYFEVDTEVMVIAGRIAKIKLGECELRDSLCIFPMALAAYKKDTDYDYNIHDPEERNKPHNKILIKRYLKNDCKYLLEVVLAFLHRFGINLTVAGTAMKEWRKLSGIKTPQTSQHHFSQLKDYYYGGRVECFQTGVQNKKFKVIDINSAYPYVMTRQHPYGEIRRISTTLPKIKGNIERCFIKLRAKSLGVFPTRVKGKSLEFPADGLIREFHITGWEYLSAKKIGKLKKCEILKVTELKETICFIDYVKKFFAEKTQCKEIEDIAGYLFAKIMQNGLYGKYASNPEKYRNYLIIEQCHIAEYIAQGYSFHEVFGAETAIVSCPIDEEDMRFYNVGTAASITGAVRAYMMEALNACSGLIYCDTDSIAAEKIGDVKLDKYELGAWDVEFEGDWFAVAGKKLYSFYDSKTTKTKQASKGARLDSADIFHIAAGNTFEYRSESPTMSVKSKTFYQVRNISATV